MATRYAVATGNWSNPATWDGGTTLPGANDDVYANTYTVTIDQNVTVLSLRNASATNVTAGGSFVVSDLSSPRTITANVIPYKATVLTISAPSGTLNIVGSITSVDSQAANNTIGTLLSGSITMNVTGLVAVQNIGSNGSRVLEITGASTVNVTGNVYGDQLGAISININCGSNTSTVNITGNVYCLALGPSWLGRGLVISGGVSYTTINGNVYATPNSENNAGAAIAINAWSTSAVSTIDITGTVTGARGSSAIIGNMGAYGVQMPIVRVRNIVDASSGVKAIQYARWVMPKGENVSHTVYSDDAPGTPFTPATPVVITNYMTNSPAPSNVRLGTVYGPSNALTGTLAVPAANQVVSGVAVDNTTGTAAITPDVIAAVSGAQLAAILDSTP